MKATGQWHQTLMQSINVVSRYPRKVKKIMTNIQTVSRTHTRKNEEIGTLRNEINFGGIGTLKLNIIHVLFEAASNSYNVRYNHLAC